MNSQEVYDVGFDGKAAQEMLKGVSKVGLKHMAMWENGFRNCTNNDHAIETPADCKGQKNPYNGKSNSFESMEIHRS